MMSLKFRSSYPASRLTCLGTHFGIENAPFFSPALGRGSPSKQVSLLARLGGGRWTIFWRMKFVSYL